MVMMILSISPVTTSMMACAPTFWDLSLMAVVVIAAWEGSQALGRAVSRWIDRGRE
jgi:hypothetical protein